MDEKLKKIRDRNRFHKYGGMELVKELILKLPDPEKHKNGYKKSFVLSKAVKIAKQKMGPHRKKKHHNFLAETILRYAVGNGYLRPVGENRYILTKKSRKLREAQQQKNSTSKAQNIPSESIVPAET